jgi:hypothetical protein
MRDKVTRKCYHHNEHFALPTVFLHACRAAHDTGVVATDLQLSGQVNADTTAGAAAAQLIAFIAPCSCFSPCAHAACA